MRFEVKHKPIQQVGAKRYIMKLAWWPTRVKQYDTDIEYDVWLEYYQSHEELVSRLDRWDGSTYLYWRVIDKRI